MKPKLKQRIRELIIAVIAHVLLLGGGSCYYVIVHISDGSQQDISPIAWWMIGLLFVTVAYSSGAILWRFLAKRVEARQISQRGALFSCVVLSLGVLYLEILIGFIPLLKLGGVL